MAEGEGISSLEYTPTWVVAVVCFIIVLISLCAARSLHKLGKFLQREKHDALYQALEKLKEELMLLGFISLLLTVFQNLISKICIPSHMSYDMLPCKRPKTENVHHARRLLSAGAGEGQCKEGKVPLLSLEALHHLHIFIFVLAVVHVVFCVATMALGGAKMREWKQWEDKIKSDVKKSKRTRFGLERLHIHFQSEFFKQHAEGYWRKAALVGWVRAFFKQFYGSVSHSDYIALRHGFIKKHCPEYFDFDFHNYMLRTLLVDFRKIVGISWYLWLFVVLFLLLNLDGWNTYFWLSFLPLILLLLVGAKLEHIIIRLAQENAVKKNGDQEAQQNGGRRKTVESGTPRVKPSNKYFWFGNPGVVLILIHFILFQNSFEIAFFFWILCTYGFHSCIMEKVGFIIPRLIIGVIVQVLCSYSTLPLYAIVTQMGSTFKEGMFKEHSAILAWLEDVKSKQAKAESSSSVAGTQINKMDRELSEIVKIAEQAVVQIAEQDASVADAQIAEQAVVKIAEQAEVQIAEQHASVAYEEGSTESKKDCIREVKLPFSSS